MSVGIGSRRSVPVDAAKTAAIWGTLLIHTSAVGGFAWPLGSLAWVSNLFWSSVLRCAVPVFFLCSGALLLPPEKDVSLSRVWKRYIPRIAAALFFWAAAYAAAELFTAWRDTGVLEAAALCRAAADLLLLRHKSHLYYLQILLLVYALLPLCRLLAARADRRLTAYIVGLWFFLGCLLPALRPFPPVSLLGGIPGQYPLNLTWSAVGYSYLGFILSREAPRRRPAMFAALYLLGLALPLGGSLWLSLRRGQLYEGFFQGTAPGVCLQAAGVFGLCASALQRRTCCRWTETISRASFCIYLVHLFFLDELARRGITAAAYAPAWAVPALAAVLFLAGFLVWLVLRRVPLVKKYLI